MAATMAPQVSVPDGDPPPLPPASPPSSASSSSHSQSSSPTPSPNRDAHPSLSFGHNSVVTASAAATQHSQSHTLLLAQQHQFQENPQLSHQQNSIHHLHHLQPHQLQTQTNSHNQHNLKNQQTSQFQHQQPNNQQKSTHQQQQNHHKQDSQNQQNPQNPPPQQQLPFLHPHYQQQQFQQRLLSLQLSPSPASYLASANNQNPQNPESSPNPNPNSNTPNQTPATNSNIPPNPSSNTNPNLSPSPNTNSSLNPQLTPHPIAQLTTTPGPHPNPSPNTADPTPPPSDRHSRDDCWSEEATHALIQAWGDRYLQLNRGNLKQSHWRDVADTVNRRSNSSKSQKTDIQCKNRLDTLKKKYKIEKGKVVTGGTPSKWTFFERLDELIGTSKKHAKQTQHLTSPSPSPASNVKVRPDLPNALPVTPNKRPFEEQTKPPMVMCPPPILIAPPVNTNTLAFGGGGGGSSPADTASKSRDGPAEVSQSWPSNRDGKRHKRKKISHIYEEDPFHDLAKAIHKFGEVYERVETTKQQMMLELEKQRMEFTKDMELQRLQLFMQTQVELAKLKHGSSSKNTNA